MNHNFCNMIQKHFLQCVKIQAKAIKVAMEQLEARPQVQQHEVAQPAHLHSKPPSCLWASWESLNLPFVTEGIMALLERIFGFGSSKRDPVRAAPVLWPETAVLCTPWCGLLQKQCWWSCSVSLIPSELAQDVNAKYLKTCIHLEKLQELFQIAAKSAL